MDKNRKISLKTALIYVIAGAAWILVSDGILSLVTSDSSVITSVSVIKGWVYVAVSGLIVFILVYGVLKRLTAAEKELFETNTEMSRTKDEISASYDQTLKLKRKLYEMAYYDQLTGLRNKMSLKEDMDHLFTDNEKFACIFLDVDNFKYVNDTLGHAFGNRILKGITDMLAGILEENCDLYRLGGDKFIILIHSIKGICDIERFALKILKSFKNAIVIDSKPFYHTVSIGVAMCPEHGSEMWELIKCSEIALYKAKDSGKNRIVIYSEPMTSTVHEWMETEKYLRTALEKSEFELYFQPQYDVEAGMISGYEALIRWRNDEMGFIMPNKFLKVAEDTHMIIPIGEWVLRNACIFLKRLQQEGFTDKTVAVNVSRMQILQGDFIETVMEDIEMADIDPRNLEIEVSESILMEYYDMVTGKLNMLKMKGVKIAIDNFGKSYSALNYLRKLPITTLKIDKTYTDIISFGEESKLLTDFMVKIGKSAKLCIIGEGVEMQEQFDYLVELGCHKLQGYFISRPLAEKDAIRGLMDDAKSKM